MTARASTPDTASQAGGAAPDAEGLARHWYGQLQTACNMIPVDDPRLTEALAIIRGVKVECQAAGWTPPAAKPVTALAGGEFDYNKTHIIDLREPIEHELKTWTTVYRSVEDGSKTFEFRKLDRDYREGDTLWLRETEVGGEVYTGKELRRVVTYCLKGGMFGVPLGYVIMALSTPPPPAGDRPAGSWVPQTAFPEAARPAIESVQLLHDIWFGHSNGDADAVELEAVKRICDLALRVDVQARSKLSPKGEEALRGLGREAFEALKWRWNCDDDAVAETINELLEMVQKYPALPTPAAKPDEVGS